MLLTVRSQRLIEVALTVLGTFSSRKECCLDLQVGVAPSNLPESLLINKFIA